MTVLFYEIKVRLCIFELEFAKKVGLFQWFGSKCEVAGRGALMFVCGNFV